jgi:hypothetical protein
MGGHAVAAAGTGRERDVRCQEPSLGVVVQVLWWLVPPLVATVVAMLWAGWAGRARDDVRRDDSDEALDRMAKALSRSAPAKARVRVAPTPMERSHGVAMRTTRSTRSAESVNSRTGL